MRPSSRVAAAALALALVSCLLPDAAVARPGDRYRPRSDATATVDADGVSIGLDVEQHVPGTSSPGARTVSSKGPSCTYTRLDPANGDVALLGEPSEGSAWFAIRCGGTDGIFDIQSIPLRGDGQPVAPGPAVNPYLLALSVRDRLPVPRARIGARPSRALVGSDTWFWLEGYDGSTLRDRLTAGGVTVEVEAAPSGFTWTWGDGTDPLMSRSTGRAYPSRSDITHIYEAASRGYEVRCAFAFDVRWRVGGGAWAPLPSISRAATRSLPVAESQAVIER